MCVHVHVVAAVVVVVVVVVTLLQEPIGETCRRAEPCASKLEFARRALHIASALTAGYICTASSVTACITSCIASCSYHALHPILHRAYEYPCTRTGVCCGPARRNCCLAGAGYLGRLGRRASGLGCPTHSEGAPQPLKTSAAACDAAASLCQRRPLCALQLTGAPTTASPQRATRQPPRASTRRSRCGLRAATSHAQSRNPIRHQPATRLANSTPTLIRCGCVPLVVSDDLRHHLPFAQRASSSRVEVPPWWRHSGLLDRLGALGFGPAGCCTCSGHAPWPLSPQWWSMMLPSLPKVTHSRCAV